MAHARPFWTFTLQDLFNSIKDTSMQGVLTHAMKFWTFGSPERLPSPIFESVNDDLTLPSKWGCDITGCWMEVAVHTLTIRILYILIWLHHMVPLKDWTEIQDMIGECNLFHFSIFPCSQNPWNSHNPTGTFSLGWTHYTLNLKSLNHQTWSCHNNHSKNP